jgi:hypothetical protein
MSYYSYAQALGYNKGAYDKYFKDGQLKQGYSTSGAIGGSKKVFSYTSRGKMAGTKDARYRKPSSTFEIYKLPGQPAAPKKKAKQEAPVQQAATPVQPSQASQDFRRESQALLDQARAEREKFAIDQANAAKAAAAQRARDEAARVERERIATLTAAARSGNERIAARSANLQIQPASTTPQTAGTQPFKRRKLQFNAPNYGGVGSIMSGILNI